MLLNSTLGCPVSALPVTCSRSPLPRRLWIGHSPELIWWWPLCVSTNSEANAELNLLQNASKFFGWNLGAFLDNQIPKDKGSIKCWYPLQFWRIKVEVGFKSRLGSWALSGSLERWISWIFGKWIQSWISFLCYKREIRRIFKSWETDLTLGSWTLS